MLKFSVGKGYYELVLRIKINSSTVLDLQRCWGDKMERAHLSSAYLPLLVNISIYGIFVPANGPTSICFY